jgi:argininosuccinate lyase
MLAYVEMFQRDADRFQDGLKRINVLPLGSGAIAGSTIVLDRESIARELEFAGVSQNSMDAVSDRDFAAELLFAIALTGLHLSRLSEDVILWASTEFGFLRLSDKFTTGSSLMPQKKNPDVAELTRGKSGRLLGNLMALLTILKGLPMTYNRDLQEDKERVFDSVDTLKMSLALFANMMAEATVSEATMLAAAGDPMLLATDLAEYLVMKGVPFRKAHEHVGRLVALAEGRSVRLDQLELADFRGESAAFDEDVFERMNPRTSMRMRAATGAPAPANIAAQIDAWKARLKEV